MVNSVKLLQKTGDITVTWVTGGTIATQTTEVVPLLSTPAKNIFRRRAYFRLNPLRGERDLGANQLDRLQFLKQVEHHQPRPVDGPRSRFARLAF